MSAEDTMSPGPTRSDLLLRWQEAREEGQELSAEELCRDQPELLDELRREIELLVYMDRLRGDGAHTPPPPPLPSWPVAAAPAAAGPPTETFIQPTEPAGPPTSGWPMPGVPGYEIQGELGFGGMGVVYRARQLGLNRLVALKMLRGDVGAGPEEMARFRTEAESVARLQHPNIVQIHDLGEHDGRPFFSMELVAGGSLARRLGGQPLPARQAAQLAEVLARAMHVAHSRGIIHRDLKPSNILLAGFPDTPLVQCTLKITDFGLVKRLDTHAGLTISGTIMGTPAYMAPEQAGGRPRDVGAAVDVYGLGAVLYEMLTGRPPFKGANMLETIEQVRAQDPVSPTRLVARVPRDLETICLKCLQKEPHKRYPSAAELADDLRRFLAGEPIRARPIGRSERAVRWARRHPAAALLAGASAVALAAIVAASSWSNSLAAAPVAVLSLLAVAWWYNARLQAALNEAREQQAMAERFVERLHLLLETTRDLVGAADEDALLRLLGETATRLANADRATIYLVDHDRRELWSRVATGDRVGEIRLPLGVGIAGTVASTGETINLPDVEADPRFNADIDRRTGYRTRNMITLPMVSPQGRVVGVFQLLNKRGSPFTAEDTEILSLLASSASVAVENKHRRG
jgi:serine/threonine-protein kinase